MPTINPSKNKTSWISGSPSSNCCGLLPHSASPSWLSLSSKTMERDIVLDRMHSTRRMAADVGGDHGGGDDDYESKKKAIPMSTRFANFIARNGLLWPCLALAFVVVLFSSSVVFYTRTLVCVAPTAMDPHSRVAFFGLDGLESDFGSLGVPWCKLPIFLLFFLELFDWWWIWNLSILCILFFFESGISQFLGDHVSGFVGLLVEISFALVARKELEMETF